MLKSGNQKSSSMFLNDTTNIDYAYINEHGEIIGGSVRPKFIVTGNIDPNENVVVDFSTIKKDLKSAIDDKEFGFDHKLWWIDGISHGEINFNNGRVFIDTPFITIEGPENILVRITNHDSFICYLTNILNEKYPNSNINININLDYTFDIHPEINTKLHEFRYVHGLKNSTSWGCQNIGHGHLSYIGAATHGSKFEADILLSEISSFFDKTIFSWDNNISGIEKNIISYDCQRGNMKMKIKNSDIKHIILDTETTIEHIVEYISNIWKDNLINLGITKIFISEGLSKGSCKSLEI